MNIYNIYFWVTILYSSTQYFVSSKETVSTFLLPVDSIYLINIIWNLANSQ